MPDRDEILHFLGECLRMEEEVIPLYSKHIESSLFLSGFREADRARAGAILDTLRKDSMRHKEVFNGLIKKVKEAGADVY
ncbi:MAG: hypothetical protein WC481_01825 [Candidatus Omnitrophota bacterium]